MNCEACSQPKPCECCSCTRTEAGRTRDPSCPVPSHAAGYTPVQMGAEIGRHMGAILAAKRASDGRFY